MDTCMWSGRSCFTGCNWIFCYVKRLKSLSKFKLKWIKVSRSNFPLICSSLKQYSNEFPTLLWFAYTSRRGTTWYSKSKTKPLCFMPENLENFSQKNFFLANLDSASKVESWFHQPPPPPPPPSRWEFWILANLNSASKFHEPPSPPPPTHPQDGNFGF